MTWVLTTKFKPYTPPFNSHSHRTSQLVLVNYHQNVEFSIAMLVYGSVYIYIDITDITWVLPPFPVATNQDDVTFFRQSGGSQPKPTLAIGSSGLCFGPKSSGRKDGATHSQMALIYLQPRGLGAKDHSIKFKNDQFETPTRSTFMYIR